MTTPIPHVRSQSLPVALPWRVIAQASKPAAAIEDAAGTIILHLVGDKRIRELRGQAICTAVNGVKS
ncbi:MAG: hypothetical protein RL030_2790 [Pseudomonadota bacterium]|jgi:hypothetical protein